MTVGNRGRVGALLIAAALCAAVGLSIGVGFAGAMKHERFDWRLCAEVGTAIGTLLLAAYTAWLATTTRQEVALAIEEQRARDRPVVATLPMNVTFASLDPTLGRVIPALLVRLHNLGLGPALDVSLEVLENDRILGRELYPLLAVGESQEVLIAFTGDPQRPIIDFRIEDLAVRGTYRDRTRTTPHDTVPVKQEGLVNIQRDAARLAALRASLFVTVGPPSTPQLGDIRYPLTITNNGEGTARDVTLWVFNSEGDPQPQIEPIEIDDIAGRSGTSLEVQLGTPHPPLAFVLNWDDASGEDRRMFEANVVGRGPGSGVVP